MARAPATEAQRAAARARIRDAAAALHRERGLSDITARAVAERAGVSVGTIYSYFGSLAGLMQSLWMEPVERFEQRLRRQVDAQQEPLERLRLLLQAYRNFAQRNAELYRAAFLHVRGPREETPTPEPLNSSVFGELLTDAIRDGQTAGVFRDGDPAQLAQLVWAGLHGALALPVNLDRLKFEPAPRLSAAMVELLVDSISR